MFARGAELPMSAVQCAGACSLRRAHQLEALARIAGRNPQADHPAMTYPPPPTDAEIAEIKRRIVEDRQHPAAAALLREPRHGPLEPEMADHDQMSDDLYRWRTGKVRPDTA